MEYLKVDNTATWNTEAPMPQYQRALREQRKATRERLERAEAQFGLSMLRPVLEARIRAPLPWRFGWDRQTRWSQVEPMPLEQRVITGYRFPGGAPMYANEAVYEGLIPDAALARYAEAKASGVFDALWVVEAVYVRTRRPTPQAVDPWLVGQQGERYIVLAYWDAPVAERAAP